MRIGRWLAFVALFAPGAGASAQDYAPGEVPEARIWLDRGDEPLLQRGDRVRVYYRTAADAYVAIFHIDTDGAVTLLHPRAPEDDSYTRGERDYRLLFPESSYWYVDEYPGKGYFFLVASPEPLDLSGIDYSLHERRWDLTQVGQTVYRDPYLAMDDYVARLIPNWEQVPYALDFVGYDVGEVHEYPRFLCYDCHGYRPYVAWNPYTYACASFRVVVWDDPWYYPTYRYQGTRVAYATPRRGVARFEFKERAAGETWTPLTRTRQPTSRRSVGYVEPGAATRTGTPSAVPRRPSSGTQQPGTGLTPGGSGAPVRRAVPSDAGVRRPSSAATQGGRPQTPAVATPRRTQPSGAVTPEKPQGSDRPVLQRRPTTGVPSRPSGGATIRPPSGATSRPSSGDRPAVNRPSGGSTRAVTPPRSGGGSSRPSASSRPSSSSRPPSASRPPARSGGGRASTAPPRRRGGGS